MPYDKVNATPRFAGSRIYFVLSPSGLGRMYFAFKCRKCDIMFGNEESKGKQNRAVGTLSGAHNPAAWRR